MTPSALFDLFRKDVVDEEAPYLWSDDEVWGYMDDAQKTFCRKAWGISDARSALTSLAIAEGDDWAEISPQILHIRHARRASDGRDVTVMTFEQLQNAAARQDDYGVLHRITIDDITTGPVSHLILGMEQDAVRLYPIASADDTIRLVLDRLSDTIDQDAVEIDDYQFEIPEKHHRGLLLWMKHLAYSKQDAETFDKGKAAEFEERFLRYCADARVERERLEQPPGFMSYGGL